MASVVDICNIALARLGDAATVASIDPPEGSAQAEHCARFYPIARDAVLQSHLWSFTQQRAQLPLLVYTADAWAYAYALPADVLQVYAVHSPNDLRDTRSRPFKIEAAPDGSQRILTDQPDAVVFYSARMQIAERFPPMFTEALTWLLASYLAGSVIKGTEGIQAASAAYKSYLYALAQAQVIDANQVQYNPQVRPEWIRAREDTTCDNEYFNGRS